MDMRKHCQQDPSTSFGLSSARLQTVKRHRSGRQSTYELTSSLQLQARKACWRLVTPMPLVLRSYSPQRKHGVGKSSAKTTRGGRSLTQKALPNPLRLGTDISVNRTKPRNGR
ncbi:hypothetical protein Bbelb_046950 [Branchiostoma belcheri]|nr:hypothetical protein Bbelb_046950 [Branchiostoma belcheri]